MKVTAVVGRIVLGLSGGGLGLYLSTRIFIPLKSPLPFILGVALTVLGVFFGSILLPLIYRKIVLWFVGLLTITVQVTVARTMGAILATQAKKMNEYNARKAKKREESNETKKIIESLRKTVSPIVVDTSAIIDGRLFDVARAGFIHGKYILPYFVIEELQKIADSPDDIKRQRGRRGLDLLNEAKKNKSLDFHIWKEKVEGSDVDGKLMSLSKAIRGKLATVDYNLNKAAGLLGVSILNVNDLANIVKTVLLPGEVIQLKITQKGKEPKQGVGYLDDGTMVVIEDGGEFIETEVTVKVNRLLQTPAGKMVFAKTHAVTPPDPK